MTFTPPKIPTAAPVPSVKAIAAAPLKGSYEAQFVASWKKRVTAAASVKDIDLAKLKPIIAYDWNRIKNGSSPLSNLEAGLAVNAALRGKSIIKTDQDTGTSLFDLPGNLVGDVGEIAASLNPMKLVPALYSQAKTIVEKPQKLVKPISTLATGDVAKAFKQASHTPGLQLIPGVYTVSNLLNDPGELIRHPGMTILDVLPYAVKAGKVAMGNKVVEKGSAAAALKEGRPLKAGFRALAGSTDAPVSRAGMELVNKAGQFAPKGYKTTGQVPRTSDWASKIAENVRVDKATREYARSFVIERRKMGIKAQETFAVLNDVMEGLDDEARLDVLHAAQRYQPGQMVDHPYLPQIKALHEHSKALQKQAVERGGGVMVPNTAGDLEYYTAKSAVGRAYGDYAKLEQESIRLEKAVAVAESRVPKRTTHPQYEERLARLKDVQARQKIADTRMLKSHARLQKEMQLAPPERFHPMLEELVRGRVAQAATKKLGGRSGGVAIDTTKLQIALEKIQSHEINVGELIDMGVITRQQWNTITADVAKGWQDLVAQGYDPVFVPYSPVTKNEFVFDQKPLAGNVYKPRMFREAKVFSFAPQMQDAAIGLSAGAMEIMKHDASVALLGELKKYTVSEKVLAERFGRAKAQQLLATAYDRFDELTGRILTRDQISVLPDENTLYIPRTMGKTIDQLMAEWDRTGLRGVYDKTMGIYKLSVLTGPRHIAHVLFGGFMFMALEQGPMPLKYLKDAMAMARGQGKGLPIDISRGLDQFTPDEIGAFRQGKTLGRIWRTRFGKGMEAIQHFEEFISNTYRAASYLDELAKQGKKGTRAAHDRAVSLVNRIYMDIDALTPVERLTLRQIFPFYTFTKHILRYLLNYPADHPVRAAVLASITRYEHDVWDDTLPSHFQNFVFFGGDNEGNVSAIDLKNMNPFRGLEGQNPFTLAGFLSNLSPFITSPASLAGISTLSATPELYPELTYDPSTGKLIARHPDFLQKSIGLFLPPVNSLMMIGGLTSDFASLKKSNPDAFARALQSSMNLPLWYPFPQNLAVERTKTEFNRYKAAQGDVTRALRSGDTSSLKRYNVVPFQGELVESDKVAELIKVLNEVARKRGVSTGTVVPRG